LNYTPKKKLPVEEYLKKQGRFSHMLKKGNEWMIETYQAEIDRKWEDLLFNCSRT
jgi:pyruvate ferredoxin oxidoreductase beta subunit